MINRELLNRFVRNWVNFGPAECDVSWKHGGGDTLLAGRKNELELLQTETCF